MSGYYSVFPTASHLVNWASSQKELEFTYSGGVEGKSREERKLVGYSVLILRLHV